MTESPPDPWSRPPGDPSSFGGSGRPTAPPETPGVQPAVHYGPVTRAHAGTGRPNPPPEATFALGAGPLTPGPVGITTPIRADRGMDDAPDTSAYARWGSRVVAWSIDHVPHLIAGAVLMVGYARWVVQLSDPATMSPTPAGLTAVLLLVGGALAIVGLGWSVINRWVITGRTGRSLGKRRAGLRLVGADTGAPVGASRAFVRDLVHILDGLSLVGWLWPRWDERRQTLADKLMRTVVVRVERSGR